MIELQSVERGAKEHSNRYSSYLKINPGCHFFQKFKRRPIRRPNKLSAFLSVKFLGGERKMAAYLAIVFAPRGELLLRFSWRTRRRERRGIYQDENYASHRWTMACRASYRHSRSVARVLSGRRIAQVSSF